MTVWVALAWGLGSVALALFVAAFIRAGKGGEE